MLSKRVAFTKSAAHFGGSSSRKGRLFVISASSGTGKTTLARELLKGDKRLVASVSCTTRPPRPGERNGGDYYFVTKKEFLKIREKNGFLEWANVFGHHYGTPKRRAEGYQNRGLDVLLLIDVQGAKQVKRVRPDAVFVFLAPPSMEELRRRLAKRATESVMEINRRLKAAKRELVELNDPRLCDYRIVNRTIPRALEVLKGIIRAERMRVKR